MILLTVWQNEDWVHGVIYEHLTACRNERRGILWATYGMWRMSSHDTFEPWAIHNNILRVVVPSPQHFWVVWSLTTAHSGSLSLTTTQTSIRIIFPSQQHLQSLVKMADFVLNALNVTTVRFYPHRRGLLKAASKAALQPYNTNHTVAQQATRPLPCQRHSHPSRGRSAIQTQWNTASLAVSHRTTRNHVLWGRDANSEHFSTV